MQQLESTIIILQQQRVDCQEIIKEPKISLPAKFDGLRAHFRGFLNQVRLVIQMHPMRYSTNASRAGLVGTLLTDIVLAWFAPLLEKISPLLNNFEEFIKEFKACFGILMRREQLSTRFVHFVKVNNQLRHMLPISVSSQAIFLGTYKA